MGVKGTNVIRNNGQIAVCQFSSGSAGEACHQDTYSTVLIGSAADLPGCFTGLSRARGAEY